MPSAVRAIDLGQLHTESDSDLGLCHRRRQVAGDADQCCWRNHINRSNKAQRRSHRSAELIRRRFLAHETFSSSPERTVSIFRS